ncbi:hypothetical protein J3R82DRAFT_1547 [Butyriboletus roseoflavus]|nr:hypothetical protein J3R82DRAFT_1547 [Butyriboletus roseoflavus]
MVIWTLTSRTSGQRVWQRPLGITESVYYWSGCWNGAGDTIMHVHLRAMQPNADEVYAPDNVRRAWASVKRRFPLLAAEVHEEVDGGPHFVVREQNVISLQDGEVTFGTVSSLRDAERFVDDNKDGPRPLSSKMLTRVYVLRRTDWPDHFHVVLTVAHCITDGCSTSTVIRSFFQTLATSFDPCPRPIEERLRMYCPIESRIYPDELSPSKRRWRRAIGYAIYVARSSRLTGGHTLPGNFTQATASTPAKSRLQVISFPRDVSALILSNCRHHNITLNSAYHALSQVAISRLLCRRYLTGEILEEEWEYRKRQPMLFTGLVNLRPHWDKDWFKSGGSGEVGLNFGFYQHVLPFMPLGTITGKHAHKLELVDGAPLFEDLMSFDRFFLRCGILKRRIEELFRHPRFLDISIAGHSDQLILNKGAALAWRRAGKRVMMIAGGEQPLPMQDPGPTFAHGGSTLGDMDHVIPLDYPIPARHQLSPLCPYPHPHRAGYPVCVVPGDVMRQCGTPRLRVEHWRTHLRMLPGDLYLGAVTARMQLQFFAAYDENVYGAHVIREWLAELKEATRWYLARPQGARDATTKSKL